VKEIMVAGREVLIEENPYSEGAPEYVTVRVHWNHDFIDPDMVPSLLMHHFGAVGVIVKDEFEVSVDDDFSNVCTGVRRLVVKTKDRARILRVVPLLLDGVVDKVHFRFLVTIVGRPALCLKCKMKGHKSFECPHGKGLDLRKGLLEAPQLDPLSLRVEGGTGPGPERSNVQ
jgi:hypothetical protein